MKTSIPILLFYLATLSFSSCLKDDKLIGTWERYDDKFEGMQIEVIKEGDSFKAILTTNPKSSERGGFSEGDVKWKNIRNTSSGKYELEDLYKVRSLTNIEATYKLTNVELVTENEIRTRLFSFENERIGKEQKWKRIVN